jgi:hypothetical protein
MHWLMLRTSSCFHGTSISLHERGRIAHSPVADGIKIDGGVAMKQREERGDSITGYHEDDANDVSLHSIVQQADSEKGTCMHLGQPTKAVHMRQGSQDTR